MQVKSSIRDDIVAPATTEMMKAVEGRATQGDLEALRAQCKTKVGRKELDKKLSTANRGSAGGAGGGAGGKSGGGVGGKDGGGGIGGDGLHGVALGAVRCLSCNHEVGPRG